MAIRVRPLGGDDLGWASSLQRSELPHGFFTRLGLPFLRAYQRTFVDSPYALALVAEDGGACSASSWASPTRRSTGAGWCAGGA